MKADTIKNKNILITGVTGFVGKHLENKLLALEANVFGISHNEKNKKYITADVTDLVALEKIIKNKKIDICFHLAGESLVESGQTDPYKTFQINTLGTLNILELGRKYHLEKIIIASTSHVYGENRLPYYEGYSPRPSRPYETSKTCTDLIAQSYANTFNLPVLIPRFVNIYGPGDVNFTRLIPKTIRNILHDENPTMWGGGAIRDYLFISDAINAYILLAQIPIKSVGKNRIFNFGSNNRTSVHELIDTLIRISGKNLNIKKIEDSRINEIKAQYVSWSKAKRILEWNPEINLEEGLSQTIAWYQQYFKDHI